jgi:hypothetical protein
MNWYPGAMFCPPWVVEPCRLGQFEWDTDIQWEVLGEQDDAFAARLAPLSGKAQVAFSLGCAEWIMRATRDGIDESRFRPYLASRWLLLAGEVQVSAGISPRVLDAEDVPTSVADAAVAFIEDTYFGNGNGEYDCALASMLVMYVLDDTTGFERWQDHCIETLTRTHSSGRAEWDDQRAVFIDELSPAGPAPATRSDLYAPLRLPDNPFVWTGA